MSTQTDPFGHAIILGLFNSPLYEIHRLLNAQSGADVSPEVAAAVNKLTEEDKAALRGELARIVSSSIEHFIYGLDRAADTIDGLKVTYDRKPLTDGDFAFGRDYPKWKTQFGHYNDKGEPNEKAFQ